MKYLGERYPRLKVVLAESEIGWLPFVLEQWDYYQKRRGASSLAKLPSEYFHEQVYATFFTQGLAENELVGTALSVVLWWRRRVS